ncbi:MAG: GNAT family protein [Bacteroidota bacterium]
MKISTNRLAIRNLQLTDLNDFHSYRCLPAVALYQGFDIMNKEECEKFIREYKDKELGKPGEWVQFAIAQKQNDQLVGDCAIKLHAPDPRIAEIGMSISPSFQQRGYAKEAMLGIMNFLFNQKEVHRIVEITDAENKASIQLLKSLGFRQEGHFIENIWFNNKWGSEYQYAMLRKEWENNF